MFRKKEKVFCGECRYFQDGMSWYQKRCLYEPTIRVDESYKERIEVTIYAFPQTRNKNNRCSYFEKKK
ncbi:MAG: hypothetical protein DRO67_01650 [Candidatus Asgardarchaeum californiense]|nr:MAG: hypothetical protein DRO67_01650 [Candidatus Asgardarchaeum californiense]